MKKTFTALLIAFVVLALILGAMAMWPESPLPPRVYLPCEAQAHVPCDKP